MVYFLSCIWTTPLPPPLRAPAVPSSPLILTFRSTGKCFKCTHTHACTHCSVAVSVVVGYCVLLFKILARPHSWIMLLRNRSVWKCSTAPSCRPVDTKVKSHEELWLHHKHQEYYLDAVQYLLILGGVVERNVLWEDPHLHIRGSLFTTTKAVYVCLLVCVCVCVCAYICLHACVVLSWPGESCVIAGLLLLSLMGNDTFAN